MTDRGQYRGRMQWQGQGSGDTSPAKTMAESFENGLTEQVCNHPHLYDSIVAATQRQTWLPQQLVTEKFSWRSQCRPLVVFCNNTRRQAAASSWTVCFTTQLFVSTDAWPTARQKSLNNKDFKQRPSWCFNTSVLFFLKLPAFKKV